MKKKLTVNYARKKGHVNLGTCEFRPGMEATNLGISKFHPPKKKQLKTTQILCKFVLYVYSHNPILNIFNS